MLSLTFVCVLLTVRKKLRSFLFRKMSSSPNADASMDKSSESTPIEAKVSEGDKTCVVCFKIVDIFSIGECDHPVCYECSTSKYIFF